jgi:hypothetical protein
MYKWINGSLFVIKMNFCNYFPVPMSLYKASFLTLDDNPLSTSILYLNVCNEFIITALNLYLLPQCL